jgi:hypothetical protein
VNDLIYVVLIIIFFISCFGMILVLENLKE